MFVRSHSPGFTLIEVLVSITIIGILVGVLTVAFSSGRESAVNKTVYSDLKQMQLAIERYKAQHGRYPAPMPTVFGQPCATINVVMNAYVALSTTNTCFRGLYIEGLVPDFMPSLMSHEEYGNENCTIAYAADATDGAWYKLTARNCLAGVDTNSGVGQTDEFARCPDWAACGAGLQCDPTNPAFYESPAVYSPGGECY